MKLGARHPEVETVNPNDRMEGKGIQIGGSVGLEQDGVIRAFGFTVSTSGCLAPNFIADFFQ